MPAADTAAIVINAGGDEKKLDDYLRVNRWLVSPFAEFVAALRDVEDSDGSTLLDNCAVIMTSELGDGSSHSHDNLLCLLAGGAGGRLAQGGQPLGVGRAVHAAFARDRRSRWGKSRRLGRGRGHRQSAQEDQRGVARSVDLSARRALGICDAATQAETSLFVATLAAFRMTPRDVNSCTVIRYGFTRPAGTLVPPTYRFNC
jgi:hypothetical protein